MEAETMERTATPVADNKPRRGDIKANYWDKISPEEKKEHFEKVVERRKEKARKRREMKEQLDTLLSLPVKDKKIKEQLKMLGLDLKNMDNQMLMLIVMWQQVLKGRANCVPAFNALVNVLGEGASNQDINANLNMTFRNDLPANDPPMRDVTPQPREIENGKGTESE